MHGAFSYFYRIACPHGRTPGVESCHGLRRFLLLWITAGLPPLLSADLDARLFAPGLRARATTRQSLPRQNFFFTVHEVLRGELGALRLAL